MTLNTIEFGSEYVITNLNYPKGFGGEFIARFYHLGIVPGQKIKLTQKAPWFHDPILFDLQGNAIAMTKEEASFILVEKI